ncbi:MAG TPA: heme ABC exporter ATP-binding protein CcmA [Methylomirabilota bacterium]|nr:heme ABC exporter ATP-binding protein CcmA [Methylomirabilota bacterium]
MSGSASLNDATVILDDHPVLRGVSVEIGPGLTLVRGPNGAGKTTLLRALAGLVPLARGSRTVSGAALYVGHRSMLLRGLSARANLSFFASFRGMRSADVGEALRRWGLTDLADRPVERLSAGQRKRAALARLDVEQQPVVLLDEPFADLDRAGMHLVRDAIVSAVVREQAVVVVTHSLEELDRDAAQRLLLDDGVVRKI